MYPVRHVGNVRHLVIRPAVYSSLFQRHGSTAKFLKKIIEKGGKKKKFRQTGNSPTAGQYVSEGKKFQSFRVSQVIHDAIVEYFDTGELDPDIPPLGVSISKVVWSPEMSSMNVFWQIESDDVKKRDQVKNLINSKAKKLRALLIGRRISGHIPVIQFVWDKSQRSKFHLAYIDKMLAEADYGPDHTSQQNITHSELDSPVLTASPKLLEKIQTLSTKTDPNALPEVEDIEKSFSDDIYGLERNLLLASIKDSKDKLEAGLKKREKRLRKQLKKANKNEDGQKIDLSRTRDVPLKRVSEIQKLMSEDKVGEYLEKLEQTKDNDFLKDEWSDDEEEDDIDEEDDEVNIIGQKTEEGSSKHAENSDTENINESQLQRCDNDNNVKDDLDLIPLRTESLQTLNRHGLRRSSLSSPIRVREMQRFMSEENMEDTDNDVDLMKSEWSDDEKSDDEVKPENKKHK